MKKGRRPSSSAIPDGNITHQETEPINYNPLWKGELMPNLKGLASFVSALRVERTNLVNQLRHVDAALSVLGKLDGGSSYTKPRRTLSASARPERTMSAAGRKKIAAAQRRRWAKWRKARG